LPKLKMMTSPPPRAGGAAPGSERYSRDPLTGLPDEHLFRQQLPPEFDRARDRERNAALLAVKLDGIGELNDRFGRASGDEALLAVTSVLEGVRAGEGRQAHLLFKLAGSLFGYYLPEASAAQARELAEEIHQKVQQSEAYLQPLTVSIGIVNFYEFFLEEGSRAELAQRLRQTLLHRVGVAERQGANTICDSSEISAAAVSTRPTVLLVDPDPDSMELLVRALEAAELVVQVFRDGESAWSAIQASPPAAIVCEAMCPRLSGFAIRERLRTSALWNSIPFILVSHRKNEDLIRKAVERDIRHFFRKPVSLTEVAGLIVNLTRRRGP
jgi:diguanylate cyclase (GGDEF)-like protein